MTKSLKSLFVWLIAICYLPIAAFAQTGQTASDYIAKTIQLTLLNPPQQVPGASVFVSGNPGPATYYYWIVTQTSNGASSPAGPFAVINAPNTLSVSNFNQVNWTTVSGATSYDVLRTSNTGPPFAACNCAVATGLTGNAVNDQANALQPYTVNTLDPSTLTVHLTNQNGTLFSDKPISNLSLAGAFNGTVGATTPNTGAFTTLTSTGGAINGTVGATIPNTGDFTTLTSTGGAINGTIGATTPNTGDFTTLTSTGGALNGSIGATTPAPGDFTSVTASGIVKGESFGGAATSAVQAVGGNASITIDTTNATADNKLWDIATDGSNHLLFRVINDAVTLSPSWLRVSRSGASINSVVFGVGAGSQSIPSGTYSFVGDSLTQTITNKTLQSPTITSGISQGSGLKHQRFGATCTTGATTGATCTTTYSWTSAFADANYTPVCITKTPTFNALFSIESWTASGVTVRLIATTANASSFAGVNCIAIHD